MKYEGLTGRQSMIAQPECRTLVELDDLLDVSEKFLEPLRGWILWSGRGCQVARGQCPPTNFGRVHAAEFT
jgi:hypothetical protein